MDDRRLRSMATVWTRLRETKEIRANKRHAILQVNTKKTGTKYPKVSERTKNSISPAQASNSTQSLGLLITRPTSEFKHPIYANQTITQTEYSASKNWPYRPYRDDPGWNAYARRTQRVESTEANHSHSLMEQTLLELICLSEQPSVISEIARRRHNLYTASMISPVHLQYYQNWYMQFAVGLQRARDRYTIVFWSRFRVSQSTSL